MAKFIITLEFEVEASDSDEALDIAGQIGLRVEEQEKGDVVWNGSADVTALDDLLAEYRQRSQDQYDIFGGGGSYAG